MLKFKLLPCTISKKGHTKKIPHLLHKHGFYPPNINVFHLFYYLLVSLVCDVVRRHCCFEVCRYLWVSKHSELGTEDEKGKVSLPVCQRSWPVRPDV